MKVTSFLLTVLLAAGTVLAQQPPGGGQGPGAGPQRPSAPPGQPQGDIMMDNFFPAELVMQKQKAIGLKEDQLATIKSEVLKSLQKVTEMQWQQSAEAEAIGSL